ncbi:MAG: SDR family NAD(P)-dependent oxidoreductase [Moraxellaceae bacterium]|nr:MAG: SDR family NAD(P)-dependent oxidoreductase [Moraxellaceae bacterium]
MTNKIAIVTGGSRGLGKNTALRLASKGVDVILTFHSKRTEADSVVAAIEALGGKATALQLDVTQSKSFPQFANDLKIILQAKWQRDSFDFLVNIIN